jgi:hypothetical protein
MHAAFSLRNLVGRNDVGDYNMLWQLNVIGGQHGYRDVTKALLLPSICGGKSNSAKWSPPVPNT